MRASASLVEAANKWIDARIMSMVLVVLVRVA